MDWLNFNYEIKIIRLRVFVNLFPLWIIIFSFSALLRPEFFTWFSGNLITLGLGIIMLGMGLTLKISDFKKWNKKQMHILELKVRARANVFSLLLEWFTEIGGYKGPFPDNKLK